MSTAWLFDSRAVEYDSWYTRHRITAENEARLVVDMLRDAPTPCMEVGVGSGFFAQRAGCMFGIDPSLDMLRIALDRGIEVAVARGEALPVRSLSLGSILVVVSICFMNDPHRMMEEAYRALKPGGVMVICIVPKESPLGRYYSTLADKGHPYYSHARFISIASLVEMAREAGFTVDSIKATITYMPWERERPEEPRDYTGKEGFACIRLIRGSDVARKGGAL